jgi:TRAP-type uncharacterized transport system substrate-binding protein
MVSIRMPFWLRVASLIAVVALGGAAGFFAYRWYSHPVTLTVAVGTIDGEGAKAMSAMASQFVSDGAPVRFKVIDTGTTPEAAKAFAAGNVDLAVVRGDVGDMSQAQAIVVLTHMTVLLIAPPGSSIDSIDKLKGHTVGVLSGDTNTRIVEVLNNTYDLARGKVVFKNLGFQDARQAIQSKQVSALLVVIPLTQRYLTLVKGFFPQGAKTLPVLIPIEAAGAIADANRAYESFDVPKGTLRGAPPVPDDDLTTLRTSMYLVAKKSLSNDVGTALTEAIIKARRELLAENPLFAQITAPSTDADANLPVHPGALAVYNGTKQSFMDEYSNYIYIGPMVLAGIASVLAAAWKFLGIGQPEFRSGPLDTLYGLSRQIRSVNSEAELSKIEDQIDNILKEEGIKAEKDDETAVDATTLNVVAHRLENLIHDRREILATRSSVASGLSRGQRT